MLETQSNTPSSILKELLNNKLTLLIKFNMSLKNIDPIVQPQEFLKELNIFHEQLKKIEQKQIELFQTKKLDKEQLIKQLFEKPEEGESVYAIYKNFWQYVSFYNDVKFPTAIKLILEADLIWMLTFTKGQEFINVLSNHIKALKLQGLIKQTVPTMKEIVFMAGQADMFRPQVIATTTQVNFIDNLNKQDLEVSQYIEELKKIDTGKISEIRPGFCLEILIDARPDAMHFKAVKSAENRSFSLEFSPRIINIFHEFYHTLRALENHYAKYIETTMVIKQLYSNLEELYAIAIGQFSENSFRNVITLSNRITHLGVVIDLTVPHSSLLETEFLSFLKLYLYASVESEMASNFYNGKNQTIQANEINKMEFNKASEIILLLKKLEKIPSEYTELTRLLKQCLEFFYEIKDIRAQEIINTCRTLIEQKEQSLIDMPAFFQNMKSYLQDRLSKVIDDTKDLYINIKSAYLNILTNLVIPEQKTSTFFSSIPHYPRLLESFGVRASKATGPRVAEALEKIAEIHGNDLALKLAKIFCNWAQYHHRHFNMEKVEKFIKASESFSNTIKPGKTI